MLSEQLTRPVVDVRIEHPAADEWEVHLAGGGASVGYVTRLGSVYESIDVLPPYEVRLSGKAVVLSPKEFDFLRCLIQADGRVLSREDILEKVWGYDRSLDLDTRTVDQHVKRLREKLGPEAARVATVKGVGYKFRVD